jgi:hypothetical protein
VDEAYLATGNEEGDLLAALSKPLEHPHDCAPSTSDAEAIPRPSAEAPAGLVGVEHREPGAVVTDPYAGRTEHLASVARTRVFLGDVRAFHPASMVKTCNVLEEDIEEARHGFCAPLAGTEHVTPQPAGSPLREGLDGLGEPPGQLRGCDEHPPVVQGGPPAIPLKKRVPTQDAPDGNRISTVTGYTWTVP